MCIRDRYKEAVKTQIQNFKYYEKPELVQNLSQLFCYELDANNIELPELIIPVPLHAKRLRERGFNQSLLLAKALSKSLDIPTLNCLIKHKTTQPQASLTLKKRAKNLKKSFKLETQITAKSVAIIDDVITTGATINEMCNILKKNGVNLSLIHI